MSRYLPLSSKSRNNVSSAVRLTKLGRLFVILIFLLSLVVGSVTSAAAATITFTGTELLGRPTDTSISVSIVPNAAISLYYQYGTTSGGPYTAQTATTTASAGQPKVVTISGLTPNTKYYYRMQYSTDSGASWTIRPEKSFWTQRVAGSTFTFAITTDSHVGIELGDAANWTSTMNGVAANSPDFLIDLGDTFAMDDGSTSVALGDTAAAEQKYKAQLPTFNIVSGSSPIYIVPGNHEQQEAWHLTASNVGGNPAISLPVMGKNAEKKYFLNPVNDSFYSGDTGTYSYLSGDKLKQDYFAWTWGDALFVVISPFWTTTTKPYTTLAGGGETDTTGSGNRWDWTLGLTQFNWLQTTLQSSTAKYKFVFAHQIVGGNGNTGPVDQTNYGHGGVDSATLVEWGGYDVGGTSYRWPTNRPTADGWGSQPIRQMMEANRVTAFFHGHDHQMAYESLNGMVYQSAPSGSFTGSYDIYTTGGNSGNTIWADPTQGPGHLKVTVSPTETTVNFIRYNASTPVSDATYTMAPGSYYLTTAVSPSGGGTTSPAVGVQAYVKGTAVPVTATPAPGYTFTSWSGACTGSGLCSVTMDADKTVTANFTQNAYTLTIVSAHGTVTKSPNQATYHYGDVVTLSAVAEPGWTFTGWTPALTDNKVTITGDTSVTANYSQDAYTLTVTSAHGTVTKSPEQATYRYGDVVTLSATAEPGWTFTGWTPALTDNKVTITGNTSVTANYSQDAYTLTIISAHGTVTKSPEQATYHYGDVVTLSATAEPGWTFTGWTPALTDNKVTITGNTSVTANYSQDAYTLTVTSAHGTVTKSPEQTTYRYGDVVTLSATAEPGWTFTGWTPALTDNKVTITGNTSVTANYSQDAYTLTVVSAHGTVTKSPEQATYRYGDVVTLSAAAEPGWTFTGWTPALTDNKVTITGNTSVTANYSQDAYTLTVVSAHGTVTKSPEQATYRYGDVVTLSAAAEPGWTFTGWTPALTDNKVTITGNTSVTANYSQDAYTLTIVSAHGTVTKSPEQATYRYGDVVTLSAAAEPGWTFTGWTPALTDNKVTITGNTSVTANYSQDAYTLTIVSAHGTVTKSPEQATYRYGDVVTLSAAAEPGWTFTGWTPALTDNKVTITGDTSVTANYSQDAYTLTVVSAHGTVTKSPDQATYRYGDVVTLSAAAEPGWTFTGWTPALTDNKVTITGNTSVTANYSQDAYTLTVVSAHGTVTKSPDQATYRYGDVVTLSATAEPGWTFTGWTPALTDNKVTITGNTSVTANYTVTRYFYYLPLIFRN